MTEADIKIGAYHDAIEIAKSVVQTTGDLTGAGARMVIARLQDRIEEIADREQHRVVVEQMG